MQVAAQTHLAAAAQTRLAAAAQTHLAAAQTNIGSGSAKRLTNCILFHGYESANFRFFTSFKIGKLAVVCGASFNFRVLLKHRLLSIFLKKMNAVFSSGFSLILWFIAGVRVEQLFNNRCLSSHFE
jgi:hypothetical protein